MIRINSLLLAVTAFLAFSGFSRAEQVLFTEIMYNPAGTQPEYLELYNNTATPFDMARWRLRGGVDYDFPEFAAGNPDNTFLKPFERFLLSPVDPDQLRTAYNIPGNVRILGPWTGNLDNDGEQVTLKDKNGVTLATVQYGDGGKWPVAADGAGHSLMLVNHDRSIDDWRNWTFSQRRGGTPGTEPVAEAETSVSNPELDLSQGIPFVNYGDVWKYNDTGTDLGTAWRASAYNDTSWPSGPGLFGFEDCGCLPAPGIQTPLADGDRITRYLRTTFNYNGPTAGVTISVDLILDDGAILYLNGSELGRVGANGVVNYSNVASRTVSNAAEEENIITAGGSLLVQGNNVLAAEVHQVNTTSSDAVFGARLKISAPTQASLIINEVLPGTAGQGYIEIYNPNPVPANLRDHHLSDDAGDLDKFQIATDITVPAMGLATVGYAASGFAVANPVTVFLTAPDGVTAINAIGASMPLDGRSLGRKPTGSQLWFLFTDPTPGSPNASQSSLAAAVRINEVHFSQTNTIDWVELYNSGEGGVLVDGLFLASERDFTDKMALTGAIAQGGRLSVTTGFPAGGSDATLYLVNSANVVLTAHHFEKSPAGDSLEAFPEGSDEYYGTAVGTRDVPNNPAIQDGVVINEIMYDTPSGEVSGEYIELYNRSGGTVDLSHWQFVDGVSFTFPAGTMLPPDGYLVVAADQDWIRNAYGAIPVVGNFGGTLSNNGELLRLEDALGNRVDEVDYLPGGTWPNLANGDGSSMELRNPWMDNAMASAWSDSDETNKASFAHYTYSDVFRQLRADGGVTDHKELHLHLVGDSHVILRNILLRQNGGGANLIVNGNQMSSDNASASGWLAQGTHYASHIDPGGNLNIVADGHGDNRPNRVEIDAVGMTQNQTYQVDLDARWVTGAPRLVVQTWDHSIATSFALPVPNNLGTPGLVNTKFVAQPVPQVEGLKHFPPIPSAAEPVRVTLRVGANGTTPLVRLFHRLDNNNANGSWTFKSMYDDGFNGGDLVAGDGEYTATLTEYGNNGQVVQFYVEASAPGGSTRMPQWGSERPAMYVVDTPSTVGDLRRLRMVVSAFDLRTMSDQDGATGSRGYQFPRLSNHYWNMTLIINEKDVIYDCEVRNSGSPWTRGGNLDRGKYKLPDDQLYRGKVKYSFDNDASGGSRHHNRIVRHWLYLLGHPANEHEYIQIEINSSGSNLREEVEPLGNDMLDRIYADGSDGDLYRIDDEWWFTDGWGRSSRNADWSYKGTENSGRYRTEWIKRSREDEDDFSALISLFRKLSTGYTEAEISKLVANADVAKMSAVRGYIHDWDSFSLNRGKNGFLYRRSTDGLFMFCHWDSDLAFRSGDISAAFLNGMPGFNTYANRSYNLRLMKHYMTRLVDEFALNSARMNGWLQAEEDASNQYTVSGTYASWFSGRQTPALNWIGGNRNAPFSITTNGGNPINTGASTLSLSGSAPLRAFAVEVAGHPEARFTWTSDTGWTLSGIVLSTGVNLLTIHGVDEEGRIVHTDTIAVTKSGNAPPVMDLDATPGAWRVSVLEPLELDARDSYDPDGTPLTFNWSASPLGVQLDSSQGDEAIAFFPRPGLYTFNVTAVDADSGMASIQREALVHAPDGFSPFNDRLLEPHWNLQNVEQKSNVPAGATYSLGELSGHLTLRLDDDRAYPLAVQSPAYPFIWRAMPSLTDWVFATKLAVRGLVFGDYTTGLMIETLEGTTARYAFGIENGTSLVVRRVNSSGIASTLRTQTLEGRDATVRARRVGNTLYFDYETDNVWQTFHSTGLPAGASVQKAGMFALTDTAQKLRVSFDFAILVDPSATSELRENLRISEIMYDPVGGGNYEFVELLNIGDTPLDLTGVYFSDGIEYVFGETLLAPRQRVVVVKDQAAFASRYNASLINVAPGVFTSSLSDGGEILELSDARNVVILSVNYGTSGDWPAAAAGGGYSLQLIDPAGNLNDGTNWRASTEVNGSPGRAGGTGARTVVISEVLTHTDAPFEDAIELRNLTEAPLDISGWFLSDSDLDFKRYRIPNGTVVPALGFHVEYEVDFQTNNLLVPFSLSSANGDEVYLSAADLAGNLTGYQSSVAFGAAFNGVAFGRYETSFGEDFPPLEFRSLGVANPASLAEFRTGTGSPNAAPLVGPVVINEIMYHPPDIGGTNDNTLEEYLEIYNITDFIVPLFDPNFPTNTWRLRGGVDFDFPPSIQMLPHSYVLLVNFDPATNAVALDAFRALHGLPVSLRVMGPYGGKLSNDGEAVRLRRPDAPQAPGSPDAGMVPYVVVDEVVYNDAYPWPVEADGFGSSLQRRRPLDYANDPVNWGAASATAGRANVAGYGFADGDFDGMPDDYEVEKGFDLGEAADGGEDEDMDGRNNRGEFVDGTDPNVAGDVLVAPAIGIPPGNDDVAAGGSGSFSVTATGTGPLHYQWWFNNAPVSGGTGASLVLPMVDPSDAGDYSVVVYNAAGFVRSGVARLTVNQALAIEAQPLGQFADIGNSATFSVFAVGTGDLHYQWKVNGTPIPGATSAMLTLNNLQSSDSGGYTVDVTDDTGTVTSATASLEVLSPPTIVQQPAGKTVVAYQDTFFSVTAGGQGPFTYQWRLNGVKLTDATNSVLALPNVQPNQAGLYSVEVFNPVSSVVSANAQLNLLIPATITQQPFSQVVDPGDTVTFTVAAFSTTPITYQWRFNDVDIPGATTASLTLMNVQEENVGNYRVVVTDDIGVVESDIAILTVLTAPVIVHQPQPRQVVEGDSFTLSIQTTGALPMSYRWRRGFTTVTNMIITSHQSFLHIDHAVPGDGGNYTVVLTNAAFFLPGVLSANATVAVVADADGDGMGDAWEDENGLNSSNGGDGGLDLDNDGLTNLEEFQAGTNPDDENSYLRMASLDQGTGTLVTFHAASNMTYTVEYTDNLGLGLWNRLADFAANPTNRIQEAFDPQEKPSRYYRVVTPRQQIYD